MFKDCKLMVCARIVLSVVVLVGLFLGLSGIIYYLKENRPEPAKRELTERIYTVATIPLEKQTFPVMHTVYGQARPLRKVSLFAEVAGRVVEATSSYRPGEVVAAGTVLTVIDPSDYQQRVLSTQASVNRVVAEMNRITAETVHIEYQLEIARKDLISASAELERAHSLRAQGVNTQREVDQARISFGAHERMAQQLAMQLTSHHEAIKIQSALLEQSKAERATAQQNLARTVIRAPFAGRIATGSVERGDYLSVQHPVFELIDLSRVEIEVQLPASLLGDLQQDQPARFRLLPALSDAWLPAQISRVAPQVDLLHRTVSVFLEVDNPPDRTPLLPGAFVEAQLPGPVYEDIYVLPRYVLVDGQAIVVNDATPSAKFVTPNIFRLVSEWALARDGVPDGGLLVTTNVEQLFDGAPLSLLDTLTRQPPSLIKEGAR